MTRLPSQALQISLYHSKSSNPSTTRRGRWWDREDESRVWEKEEI